MNIIDLPFDQVCLHKDITDRGLRLLAVYKGVNSHLLVCRDVVGEVHSKWVCSDGTCLGNPILVPKCAKRAKTLKELVDEGWGLLKGELVHPDGWSHRLTVWHQPRLGSPVPEDERQYWPECALTDIK